MFSASLVMNAGVRQGSVEGPDLFPIFICSPAVEATLHGSLAMVAGIAKNGISCTAAKNSEYSSRKC